MDTVTFGRYQLIALVGQGGMGNVYKARDTVIGRNVAVKVLPAELANEPGYAERFRREAHTAAQLTEPHIIPIHDTGEIDGRLFLVMPLIDGIDVHSLLERDGPMGPQRAVHVVEQLAAALNAAHRHGLVHRDVKPSNALITGDDFVYLIDFGIAHDASATKLTQTGSVVGTWAYMSPERLNTGTADVRADIYALACVLYECLTGVQPFPGNSMEQQVVGHLTMDPPKPNSRNPAIPAAFDEVIARGMAKNPEQRYQSAQELATASRHALAELSTRTSDTAPTGLAGPARSAPVPPDSTPPSEQLRQPAKTRQVIDRGKLGPRTKIGQGGQGVVYRAPNAKTTFAASMVYKEYKPQARADIDFAALAAMPALVEESLTYAQAERLISIAAWPCAIIEDDGTPTGFVMPAIPDEFFISLTTAKGISISTAEFQHLLNHPTVLAARGITLDDEQRYTLLRETASALTFLHKHRVCVGDISPKNLLFSLSPHEAVYFIDCDAVRINSVSALPQVETPGWNAPSGEELATIYTDTYKLGLLALRLLIGDQDTISPAHLPATTPTMLRQIITDTLTKAPDQRPLPEAWTHVLGDAIELAQHQKKTATRDPKGANAVPTPPPMPVVHSRPLGHSAPPLRTSAPSPLQPGPPPASIPSLSRPAASRTRLWAGIAVASLVAVVLVVVMVALNHQNNSAPSSAPLSTSTMSSAAWPPAAAEPSMTASAPTSTQIAGANGTLYTIQGPMLAKWETLNDAQKTDLGAPYDNQKNTADNSGVYQQFDDGVLIYRNGGPVYLVWGKIRDAWNDVQASQGKLGYPTSDEVKEPDGSYKSTFEHGTVTWKEGDEKATVTTS